MLVGKTLGLVQLLPMDLVVEKLECDSEASGEVLVVDGGGRMRGLVLHIEVLDRIDPRKISKIDGQSFPPLGDLVANS